MPYTQIAELLDEKYKRPFASSSRSDRVAKVPAGGAIEKEAASAIGPILCRLMVWARLRRFQQAIYGQLDAIRPVRMGSAS